jgi:hypothetical protein
MSRIRWTWIPAAGIAIDKQNDGRSGDRSGEGKTADLV